MADRGIPQGDVDELPLPGALPIVQGRADGGEGGQGAYVVANGGPTSYGGAVGEPVIHMRPDMAWAMMS